MKMNTKKIYNFYDTSSLLLLEDVDFDDQVVVISSLTINELENIKTSYNKDFDIKFAARRILNLLNSNIDKIIILPYKDKYIEPFIKDGFEITLDLKILACCFALKVANPNCSLYFYTNDLALKTIATYYFSTGQVKSIVPVEDTYTGYKEVQMTEDEMGTFYLNLDKNIYNLLPNEYLIIYDANNQVIDKQCWTGETHRPVSWKGFNSMHFGNIKPKKDDPYQFLLMDSLTNNQITMIKGPAGSGKTFLGLAYLVSLLEQHTIDKIIVFCNTVATKGSARLGFYPGDRDEKLLDSQIGNLLISKFGSKIEVDNLISQEKLLLLPLSDIRGYDTSGMKAGIFISEAQNMDINLMKLSLQRIGEDSICIIDGDDCAQVDSKEFEGNQNGMKRASKVFRGSRIYGEVTLKNIYRSKIAEIAEKM